MDYDPAAVPSQWHGWQDFSPCFFPFKEMRKISKKSHL